MYEEHYTDDELEEKRLTEEEARKRSENSTQRKTKQEECEELRDKLEELEDRFIYQADMREGEFNGERGFRMYISDVYDTENLTNQEVHWIYLNGYRTAEEIKWEKVFDMSNTAKQKMGKHDETKRYLFTVEV